MKPVTIRGVDYPSYGAAAKALGVNQSTIGKAVKEGRTETVGLGFQGGGCPVMIRGVLYRTQKEAADALGLHPGTIKNALDRGTLDFAGFGRNCHNKRPIIVDGVEYQSIADAARVIGVKGENLACYAQRRRQKGITEFEYRGHKVKEPRND